MLQKILSVVIVISVLSLEAQDKEHRELDSPFASFVEPDFPCFTQTLDARHLEGGWPKENLTPRGIIVKLGKGHFACFDTDLLRIALVWKENEEGEYLTMRGMAPGSYRLPNRKASAGQESLPRPIGTPLLATGIYPGVWVGEGRPDFLDPRERSVDREELGLGPLPTELGRFLGLRYHRDNEVALEYEIGGVSVIDRISLDEKSGAIIRRIDLPKTDKTIQLIQPGPNGKVDVWKIQPGEKQVAGALLLEGKEDPVFDLVHDWQKTPPLRWPEKIVTKLKPSARDWSGEAFVRDEVELPLENPWKRNVRLSGLDFFPDGKAAVCTFDGDVWIVEGLTGGLENVTWKRFASGLHEPIALEISGDELYVFDRNGIQRLQDTDDNGEADFIENFCNLVAQTAETREFANDLVEKPGGGFYIAKGGQVSSTRGKYNGTVVEISPDGKSYQVIATGFRMPYIGVDPKTGLLTASDQQGHWKPATPVHVVEKGEYYGFQPSGFKEKAIHPQVIDEPEIWVPHFANQSGASQLWLRDAKMGPLNDSLIHVGYNRPEIFRVYLDERGSARQGAIASIMDDFPSGILKARVHPVDGTAWFTGFKIWGTAADQISGLYRVRSTSEPCWVPESLHSFTEGVVLRFSQPVDKAIATNLANYTVDRWNYWRSSNYGSGNFKLDGKPGQETLPVASVTLSKDKRSVLLGIPDMKICHSLRVSYRRPVATSAPVIQHAYFTVHQLHSIDLKKRGFGISEVNLTLKQGAGEIVYPDPSVELGKQTATTYGCIACHTTDGSKLPANVQGAQVAVGPTWKHLWGSKREFTDGSELRKADAAYLRESIIDPGRRVTKGFEAQKTGVGMPSYLGVLKDHEIDSIVLYIESLRKK